MTYEDFAAAAAFGLAPVPGPFVPDQVGTMQPGADLGVLRIPDAANIGESGSAPLLVPAAEAPPTLDWQLASLVSGGAVPAGTMASASAPAPDGGIILLDEDPLPLGNDGVDDELTGGDATVTGYRNETYSGGGTSAGGSTGSGGETSSGDYGDTGGDAKSAEPNDCRDRNALEATGEIKSEPDDGTNEHGSFVYRAADGVIRHSPPMEGDPSAIPREVLDQWLIKNGVSYAQVLGFVHNHTSTIYGADRQAVNMNSYPSANDWNYASLLVSKGAGGSGGAGLALYIINPDGELREFQFSDKNFSNNLGDAQKRDGVALPNELKDDGSTC